MHTDDRSNELLTYLEGAAKRKAMTRRDFMLLAGAVSAGSIVASQLGPLRRMIAGGTAGGSADGIVVFIYLGGGNDGLNTVIPVDAQYSEYLRLRTKTIDGTLSSIAYPAPGSGRSDDALLGDTAIAFNPGLTNIANWYRSGKVGVIQGIGYSNPNFSHFDSQDFWGAGYGSAGTFVVNPQSGWLGRYGEAASLSPVGVVAISGGTQILPIRGVNNSGLSLSVWSGPRLGAGADVRDSHAASAVSAMAAGQAAGSLASAWSSVANSAIGLAPTINGATQVSFPSGASYVKRQLMMAANLVNANIGTRVIHCEHGGFDTHENQRRDSKGNDWHRMLLSDLDESLGVFFASLAPTQRRRVSVVVYSEFGRRPEMNGTHGTDHGAASVSFVVGDNVRGGRFGEYPSLTDLDDENLRANVDFRSLYSALLTQWLGVPSEPIIGAPHRVLANLFAAGPGDDLTTTTTTTSSTTSTTAPSTTTTAPTTTTTTSTTVPPSTSTTTSTLPTTSTTTTTTTLPTTTTTTLPTTTTTSPTTTTVAITTTTVVPTTTTTTIVDNPTTTIVSSTTTSPPTTAPTTTTAATTTTTSPTTTSPSTTTTTTTAPATTSIAPTSTTSTTTTTLRSKLPTPPPPGGTPSRSNPDAPNLVAEEVPLTFAVGSNAVVVSSEAATTTAVPTTTSTRPEPTASSTVPPPTTTTNTPTTSAPTTTTPRKLALVEGLSANRAPAGSPKPKKTTKRKTVVPAKAKRVSTKRASRRTTRSTTKGS